MRLGIQWNSLLSKLSPGGLCVKIIAWSFVPTVIILAAVAWVTFTAYQQVTEDLVIERNRELTHFSAGELATKLTDYTALLAEYTGLISGLPSIASAYEGDLAIQSDILKQARSRLDVFDGGVLVVSNQGMILAVEPKRPEILGENWSNRAYFRQMLRAPGPIFSNAVADGPGGAEVVSVAMPIKGNQGQFLGMLVGMFRLGAPTVNPFYSDISKLRVSESSSAYLVDRNGQVIYHSDPSHIGDDFSDQAVVQQVLRGEMGATHTRDFAGRDIVASFAPVPGTPWGLVTEESWASLISPSQRYRQFLLLLLALGVFVPVLVVAVGVRRITHPIAELIRAAQAVAGGNFGQKITASTGDEIEELAEQFNHMSAQLQTSYTHLERMVVERTRELSTLSAIAAVVSRSLDLEEVLHDALDKSLQVMEVEAGGIYLLDEEERVLTVAAHQGFGPQFVAAIDRLKVGEGFSGRVVQSGQPLVARDISTDPRLTRMAVREEGLRSLACVPLQAKGRVLGVLFAVTRGYREFSDQDLQLLTSIGHQVGVAIENVRLFEAERWRRQQATLLAEMAKLTSGTLDLDEVLRLTSEYAVDTFKVDHCLICLCDEQSDTLWCAIEKGFPPQVAAVVKDAALRLSSRTYQVVLDELRSLSIEDVPTDPHIDPTDAALMKLQSILVVPIEVGGRRLGVMQLGTQRPKQRHFTADEEELALAMANQAALAIESARLFKAEQRRAEQFRVINEVGRHVTSILVSDELLIQIARLIQEAFRYYQVSIGLIEDDELVSKAGSGPLWGVYQFLRFQVGQEGIGGWVAQNGEPLLVPDVSQEPRYYLVPQAGEIRSELCVPLKTKEAIIGVLDVQSDQLAAFDESDLTVLQSLANQAAIAIENARLYEQAQQAAVLEERQRLARDLHDSVTQALYGVTLYAKAAAGQLALGKMDTVTDHLRELQDTAQEALAEMRLLIHELRPPILEEEGLVVALQARLQAVEGRAGLKTTFKAEGMDRLPPEFEEGLYRIAQEALNNALKHAHARQIAVYLHQVPDEQIVALEIVDDGIGFDPVIASEQGGLGLPAMAERAAELGGQVTIKSEPGKGTSVRVEIGIGDLEEFVKPGELVLRGG